MIESTSSWTKASGSNLKVLNANLTIADRKGAPGMSSCIESHVSKRAATPLALGMPPIPGLTSITRLLSTIANWPSRKNPSRGVVAIQLGFPRPASRKEDCVVLVASLAKTLSSFLISNGLRASNLRRTERSAILFPCVTRVNSNEGASLLCCALRHQHDENHPPDRQQRVADGVGDSVAKARDLALGGIVDHPE